MSRKQELRRLLLQMRRETSPAQRELRTGQLERRVLDWCRKNQPGALAAYVPIRGEPDLLPACASLAASGLQLALPVVAQRDAPLAFAPWTPGEALHRDLAGVLAPVTPARIRPDAVLVPCLGYNHLRFRLGYGAGYYDRTLATLPGVTAIGVAWSDSLVGFIADPLDVPMALILTDEGEV